MINKLLRKVQEELNAFRNQMQNITILNETSVKKNIYDMSNEKYKTLENINDFLIIQKIKERSSSEEATDLSEAKECLCFQTECDCESNLFIEEQKEIVKKQLQLLQADERGRQALKAEIAALKRIQGQRSELIRNRQHAREIENDRAKKIALLPPPLPKSVKELLKKPDDEPKTTKPDVQMPEGLSAVKVNLSELNYENKENVLDPEELEVKQKMEAERQMKANKRFNDALKKNRLKEEYSNVMKQIQTAELQNRREMAKNISSDKKSTIPCPLSDKFQTSKQQADMEETAEKLFKRTSKKEHIIEDIEGYEDLYEEKYKKIDSNYESEMIDCIPSFVKENYDYLLKDESNFEGAKNFSGLDDSGTDVLNQAYIETPPGDDIDGRKNIDFAISRLDKLRADNETEYEQTIKPLLAAAMEAPKKELIDKAVETDSTKLPAEDKAVETDLKYDLKSPSPTQSPDFNAGVMAFKRRPREPMSWFYPRLPDMQNREVYYPVPSAAYSDGPTPGSWSSSSYCSLPSKHGVLTLHSPMESKECDICVAEQKDVLVKDVTNERPPKNLGSDKSINSNSKVLLSKYARQLAEKYLSGTTASSNYSENQGATKVVSDSRYSDAKNIGPAFEKETICKSKTGLYVERQDVKDTPRSVSEFVEKSEEQNEGKGSVVTPYSDRIAIERDGFFENDQQEDNFRDNIYSEINDESSESPTESKYDLEAKNKEGVEQFLIRRTPKSATPLSPKPLRQILPIWHELSTIQELDSALTGGSLHLPESKLSDITDLKSAENSPEKPEMGLAHSLDGMKIVSLLDPPDSEIAELAKSIHFTSETQNGSFQHSDVSKPISSKDSNVASILSKDTISIPSNLTNSSSSSASSGKVFSSTLTGNNAKRPYVKDRKFLPQFHVSDIAQTVIDSKKPVICPSSEFIPSYSSVSSSSQSLPSVIDKQTNKKKDSSSIISGYISSIEVPEMTKSDNSGTLQGKKDIVSGYNSNIPELESNKPSVSQPAEDEKDLLSVVSGYIRDIETPNGSYSGRNAGIQCTNSSLNRDQVTSESSESDGSLKLMTIHSNISTPKNLTPQEVTTPAFPKTEIPSEGNVDRKAGFMITSKDLPLNRGHVTTESSESDESLKPMTIHSNISSPGDLMGCFLKYEHQKNPSNYSRSKDQEVITTPSFSKTETPNNFDRKAGLIITSKDLPLNRCHVTGESSESDGSLKPMTIHSNISSPSNLMFGFNKYEHQKNPSSYSHSKDQEVTRTPAFTKADKSSESSFDRKAGLIISSKDSPLNRSHVAGESSESDVSLKPMTIHSNISTPSDLMVRIPKYEHKKNSSSSSGSKDLTSQEVTTTPSFPYVGTEMKRKIISSESSEFQAMILRLALSTSSLSSTGSDSQPSNTRNVSQFNYHLTLKTHLSKSNNTLLPDVQEQNEVNISPDGKTEEVHYENNFGKKQLKDTKALQEAQQCSSDFFIPHISKLFDSKVETGKRDLNPDLGGRVPKSIFSLRRTAPSIDTPQNQQNFLERRDRIESVSSNEEILGSYLKGTPTFEKMKSTIPNLDAKHLEEKQGFKKQLSNLQAISSTSSSTENLSEISESKVLYQSTPIKNISEIIKEPGILEEPDLTLHATIMTCKADPSVERKDPLTPLLEEEHSALDGISPSPSECKTPANQSPEHFSSANTPSMMSFLQHELSCFQSENTGQSIEDSSKASGKSKELREVKRSQLPRRDYKERTRRLWKNLEEVKKKNADQEKRKETERNRLRAKEYAQKITPKRK